MTDNNIKYFILAIKAIQRLCDKNKQPQDQIEEKPNKKRSRNRKKKQLEKPEIQPNPKPVESVLITNKNAVKLPTNMKWYCSPDVNITPVAKTTNSIQPQPNTVLIKRSNTNQVFTRPSPVPSQPIPLTSPTAIQINEAVNKISLSSAPIDIDKLQLPPGITITKLDPNDYKPPRDIQQSTEKVNLCKKDLLFYENYKSNIYHYLFMVYLLLTKSFLKLFLA